MKPVLYNGLQIERARFDLRRGLPVCIQLEGQIFHLGT